MLYNGRWRSGESVCFAVGTPRVHFPSRVIPKDFKKIVFTVSAWRSADRHSVENKPASSLVVSLDKALNGTPLPFCGRQVARPGEGWVPPGVLAQDSLHDEHNQNKLD